MPTIEEDGWALVSAEARQREHPETFTLPPLEARRGVVAGDAVQLLFDIETRRNGRVIDRGIDRMWVIVRRRDENHLSGVLDSDPGRAEGLDLRPGQIVSFGPEHIVRIETPPRDYVVEKYGASFFRDEGDG